MWLQLTKYLFYLSFFLNIVCGVWGVLRHHPVAQGSEQAVGPLPPEKGRNAFP